MAINLTDLFTQLGKIFGTVEALDTARGTTIPPHVQAIIDEYATLAPNYQNTIAQLPTNQISYQQQTASFISQLYGIAGNLIIETVNDDSLQIDRQLTTALRGLIFDMIDQVASVDACAVSASPASLEGTNGTALVVGAIRFDSDQAIELSAENLFAELFAAVAISTSSVRIVGQQSAGGGSAYGWPAGSGTNTTRTIVSPSDSANLVGNGDFESTNDNSDEMPDGWLSIVGDPGTSILLEGPGTSTITIAGTPTTGFYFVVIDATGQDGNTYTTTPLAYNATAEDVQAAIRALGAIFANVTVSSSGTTPNFTHTILWTGAANVTLDSITNEFDTGTSTPADTVASGIVYRQGQSLAIAGDGAELTTIDYPVSPQAATIYALGVRARKSSAGIGTGELIVELVNDVGTVIGSSTLTLNNANLTTSWKAFGTTLCTDAIINGQSFIRLRLSAAIYASGLIYVDDVCLLSAAELYANGPTIAAIASRKPATGDSWLVTAANDRAGGFQTHFERAFGMRDLDLQLPSKSDGSETINDSLIS